MFVENIELLQKVATEFHNDWIVNRNMKSLTSFFIIQDEINRIINKEYNG